MVQTMYHHAYHQALTDKIFLADKADRAGRKDCSFEQALEIIRQVRRITEGVPHIAYLVGRQYDGHDSKYPAWGEVNARLRRPGDRDALGSLLWLIEAARPYNTTVRVHVNLCDAYETSPLWDLYRRQDLLIRDKDGALVKGGIWGGEQSYLVSKAREWAAGQAVWVRPQ